MTDLRTTDTRTDSRVAGIRFQKLGRLYHFDCSDFPELEAGDHVIVETVRGRQMGQVMGFVDKQDVEDREYKQILRISSARDMMLKELWESRQLEALIDCREKASQLGGYDGCKFLEARKALPKRNKRVGTPQGEGKVIDIHPLQDAVTVLVEEAFILVKREDLVPLDEYEALESKAKGGCSKHDGGGCDCHAHRP